MDASSMTERTPEGVATSATLTELQQCPIASKARKVGSSSSAKIPHFMKPTSATKRRHDSSDYCIALSNSVHSSASSQSRQVSLIAPLNPPSNTKGLDLAVTDPGRTRNLWKKVMADKRAGATQPTLTSRAKEKARDDSGIASSAARSSTLTGSALTTTNSASRFAKVGDQDFEQMVFSPRGIHIIDSTKSILTSFHFGNEPPSNGVIDYYRSLPGLSETTLWLDDDESFVADIVRGYDSLKEFQVNEAEYAMFAMENLLKNEIRTPRLPETRLWLPERMIQLLTKPEYLWEQPPFIYTNIPQKPYGFDTRPDCCYWVSLQAFNPEYRQVVEEYVFVRQGRILCPYLTIEFKKDNTTPRQARVQVAAASALALYNRWKLKKQRLEGLNTPWNAKYGSVLKHYGLTFVGREYEFWCTKPSLDAKGHWKGCQMYRLVQNGCDTPIGVREFVSWLNEIHRWGLTVHGPACERDVKWCIESTPGAKRTSLGAAGGDGGNMSSESEDEK